MQVHFIVGYDASSFYVKCGVGVATHTNHASRGGCGPSSETTTRARFVDEGIKVFQKQLAISNIGAGKTAAAVNTKFGLQLTRRQVAYHQGLAAIAVDLQDAEELEINGRGSRSDLDILIDLLKAKGASYCALYHSKEASTFELPNNKPKKKQPFPKDKVVDRRRTTTRMRVFRSVVVPASLMITQQLI